MITLTILPTGVRPVGNPIWLRGKTDNYQALNGASQAYFFSSSVIADGDKLSFSFDGNTYTLTFKTSPNANNPFEVPFDNVNNINTAAHLALVRCLSQYFTFVGLGGIYFTAKQIDKKFDILFLPSLSSPKFSASIFNASYQAAKVAFKGYVELFVQSNPTLVPVEDTPIAVLDADPHREGSGLAANEDFLDWEFQEDLASYINPRLPEVGNFIGGAGVMINYWFKHWESYGSPPVPGKMNINGSANNYYKALKARLPMNADLGSTMSSAISSFNSSYISPGAASNRKFLTNAPTNKRTSTNTLEYLSLYVNETGDIYTEVKAYYENGTTVTLDQGGYNMGGETNDVFYFDTGFTQLELNLASTPDLIYKYEVRIIKKVGAVKTYLSQSFTYVLDRKTYLDESTILFLGDLGNWDTARFIGTKQTSVQTESIAAQKSMTPNHFFASQLYVKAKPVRSTIIEFNTGYMREEEAQWLNEIAGSEHVYMYANEKFVPLYIEDDGGVSFGDKAADLFGGGFTAKIPLNL